MSDHQARNTAAEHMESFYRPFEEMKAEKFDGKSKEILKKTGGLVVVNRNPRSRLQKPVFQFFKARSKLKRKP